MVKTLLGVAVLVAGGWLWNAQQHDNPGGAGQPNAVQVGPNASKTAAAIVDPPASGIVAPQSPPSSAAVPPAASSHSLSGKEIAELGMTRQLFGDHLLTLDGREHRILGSKEVVDQGGSSETMLLIRDELSGQISYRLPGLQFTLKESVDYEAFIREHRAMRRLFVNSIYAQVAVDAAEIAALHAALSQDSRVAKLRLMTRSAVKKPK